MIKLFKNLIILLLILAAVYFLGPRQKIPVLEAGLPELNIPIEELDRHVADREAEIDNIKPNNKASIFWADSIKQKTPYSIVYLHGYSASAEEGAPLHKEMAKRYGCNMYLPRLYGHGVRSDDVFADMTPEKLMNSAREAVAVGKILGEKVILLSCSTGGTLSFFIASENKEIHSLITYSPNFDLADKNSEHLIKPWGLQLARMMFGSKYREFEANEEVKKYWNNRYRLEGLISLKALVKSTMTPETFQKISQPAFIGYYYKNEEECDKIISIEKIKTLGKKLSTPDEQKRIIAFSNVGSHVINSQLFSQDLESVREETFKFCEEVLGLVPKVQ